jgi:hypothetical protein
MIVLASLSLTSCYALPYTTTPSLCYSVSVSGSVSVSVYVSVSFSLSLCLSVSPTSSPPPSLVTGHATRLPTHPWRRSAATGRGERVGTWPKPPPCPNPPQPPQAPSPPRLPLPPPLLLPSGDVGKAGLGGHAPGGPVRPAGTAMRNGAAGLAPVPPGDQAGPVCEIARQSGEWPRPVRLSKFGGPGRWRCSTGSSEAIGRRRWVRPVSGLGLKNIGSGPLRGRCGSGRRRGRRRWGGSQARLVARRGVYGVDVARTGDGVRGRSAGPPKP